MDISIRTFTPDDIGFAVAQTSREGWDATADLFALALTLSLEGCFIAESGGERVGMVTTTVHSLAGWIGNLIVRPEYRRQGIGEQMMRHAMKHLAKQGIKTIRLEADPPGINLYRRLGFADEFESLRFRGQWRPGGASAGVEMLTVDDYPAVAAFDEWYFGDDRSRLLRRLLTHLGPAYCLRDKGEIRGYAVAVPSRVGSRIGPCVAEDLVCADTLLRSVLAAVGGMTIVLGVPFVNREAVALFESYGFERTPSSFRMVRGPRIAVGHPEGIFAIANGAMG